MVSFSFCCHVLCTQQVSQDKVLVVAWTDFTKLGVASLQTIVKHVSRQAQIVQRNGLRCLDLNSCGMHCLQADNRPTS